MFDNVFPSIDRVHHDEASETTAQSASGWWLWHRSDIYMLSVGWSFIWWSIMTSLADSLCILGVNMNGFHVPQYISTLKTE